MENKTRHLAEKLVELGVLELTNEGQTYRPTLAFKELKKILKG